MKRQLTIWPYLAKITSETNQILYRNAAGDLLPWEKPEYIKKHSIYGIFKHKSQLSAGLIENKRRVVAK